MANLAAFRIGITISAVASALVLNGLTAWVGYRAGAERWPEHWLFRESHRQRVLGTSVLVLVTVAALSGLLTFRGLSDPRKLPNLQTFLAGLVGLAIPLVIALFFREEVNPRMRRRYRTR
jgi:hypothetical protein